MKKAIACAVVLSLCAVFAWAGPEFVEPGDAGPLPGSASETFGPGESIASIRGQLRAVSFTDPSVAGPDGADDFQDMYLICIQDPEKFTATCAEFFGGETVGFDSRMYLFDINGNGVLGNDDTLITPLAANGTPFVQTGSTFGNTPTDGNGDGVLEAGLYYLAITFAPFEPLGPNGPVFVFDDPTETSGPDGPGGDDPIEEWIVLGACTTLDANECPSCQLLTSLDCEEIGGSFAGDNTLCPILDPCPELGACFPKGSCEACFLTDAESCQIFGLYGGDGSSCPDCEIIGACIVEGEGTFCIEVTSVECDGFGGFYEGDGTTCEAPTGACFPLSVGSSECIELTQAECDDMEGFYAGDGTECPVFGACTAFSGVGSGGYSDCIVISQDDCESMEGDFLGEGSVCEGACLGKGDCFLALEFNCEDYGGTFLGPNTQCIGACFFGDSECVEVSPSECMSLEGGFEGIGSTCPIAFGPVDPPAPGDYLILLEGACFAEDVPTGACLADDGSCVVTDEFDCVENLAGVYLGNDKPCPDIQSPELVCSAIPVSDDGDDDSSSSGSSEGDFLLQIGWDASDDNGDVFVTATIDLDCASIEIANGQTIRVICFDGLDGGSNSSGSGGSNCDSPSHFSHSHCSGSCDFYFDDDGVLHVRSTSVVLNVTATDTAGNATSCSIDLCPLLPDDTSSGSSSASGSGSGSVDLGNSPTAGDDGPRRARGRRGVPNRGALRP